MDDMFLQGNYKILKDEVSTLYFFCEPFIVPTAMYQGLPIYWIIYLSAKHKTVCSPMMCTKAL